MKVKVTQSEEALVRLVSLFGSEEATHVTVNVWEEDPPNKELLLLKKGKGDSYDIVNSLNIGFDHFPNLTDVPICKISDLEVPDAWKSVE